MNTFEPNASPTLLNGGAPDTDEATGGRDADGKTSLKQADLVFQAVGTCAEVFHDAKRAPYATVELGHRASTMRLRSSEFRAWATWRSFQVTGQSVSRNAVDAAIAQLEGVALYEAPEQEVAVRVAERGGSLYIDLGDDSGAALEIAGGGWRQVDRPPVRFLRPRSLLPLPIPVRGGSIEDLAAFANVTGDDFVLLCAWLVTAFRPGLPCPILALHGEQGVGKSTLTRVIRGLVDPGEAPIRALPRKEDDLIIAALHSHVLAFDNVSGLSPWLSDALCRMVTGGGLSKRALYSDGDEVVYDARRPIVINGIGDVVNRPDLAERCLLVSLEPIRGDQRCDEAAYWGRFVAAAPRILGALLDGVATAHANVGLEKIVSLPRMADFAKWATAAESGLKLPRGAVLEAYAQNRSRAVDIALEASPIAAALRGLLERPDNNGRWEGTAKALLDALTPFAAEDLRRSKGWPKVPQQLSVQLKRDMSFLRSTGVAVEYGYRGRARWLTLRLQIETDASGATDASVDAENPGDRSADASARTAADSIPTAKDQSSASEAPTCAFRSS